MDPELATTIGALIGGAVMSVSLIGAIGFRIWRALQGIAKTAGATSAGLAKMIGAEDLDGELDARAPRHHTGAFQAIVREELTDQLTQRLGPIERNLDEIRRCARANTETIRELAEGQQRQGDLIVELTRGHARVAKRTAEHSARLNIARAEDTMTEGIVES